MEEASATIAGPEMKIVALFVLLFATLLFGAAPLFITGRTGRWGTNPEFRRKGLTYMSCFAGGVFLATCFLDLLPDYLEKVNRAFQNAGITLHFPLPEFIMAMGFFMVLVMEQIVLALRDESGSISEERQALLVGSSIQGQYQDEEHPRHTPHHQVAPSLLIHHHHHASAIPSRPGPAAAGGGDGVHLHVDLNSHSAIRAFILVFSLSLHSVFEGLAVGLQQDAWRVLETSLALLLLKSIVAFSLSLKLIQSRLRRSAVVGSLLLFAHMSPLGIALGIVFTEMKTTPQHQLAGATLEGLAAGTFAYITFMEILPHELGSPKHRIHKVALLLTGFAVVTGVLFIKL